MGRVARTKVKKTDLNRLKFLASTIIQYGIEAKVLVQKIESENSSPEDVAES